MRSVFLTQEAQLAITTYLDLRHDANPYVFISHSNRGEGKRGLTRNSVERLVRQYASFV
ncbi:MAG: hypothetical protein H6766_04570 [Candidatus Peribacteria bacterium]|nr:MAG: hypothetical protein H6766_04570 [Candidatus Peribacteria bacterium]